MELLISKLVEDKEKLNIYFMKNIESESLQTKFLLKRTYIVYLFI